MMQLISINTEHTTNPNSVAFNLDIPPSDDNLKKLDSSYESVTIKYENDCLFLTDKTECINKQLVTSINGILKDIQTDKDKEKEKRQKMLTDISTLTGMPLESKSTGAKGSSY
jgi:hypothetical protein